MCSYYLLVCVNKTTEIVVVMLVQWVFFFSRALLFHRKLNSNFTEQSTEAASLQCDEKRLLENLV